MRRPPASSTPGSARVASQANTPVASNGARAGRRRRTMPAAPAPRPCCWDRCARRPALVQPRCGPQLERTALVHLADRVVELADAAEARCECDIRHGERRRGEQGPSGLRPVRAGERERTRAELGRDHAGEVARRVSEAGRETRNALALDHAVGDETHGTRGEVVAQVPLGGAGHGVGQASLAGPQARLVRRGRREVEAHVRRLRCDSGAARSAVDARGVHAGDELAVEAGVAGLHRAIALGELGVVERVAWPSKGVLRLASCNPASHVPPTSTGGNRTSPRR